MIEATWNAFAFIMGLAVRAVGLPPLVGYLGAGFALATFGEHFGVGPRDSAALEHIAHLGVLLLLFTVGLKLKLSNLVRREVIAGGMLHFTISSLIFLPAILLILDLPWQEGLLLAIALSFSSTVLAAKVLEGKRELRALHGRVAIGVLIIQDLLALLVMSLANGAHCQAHDEGEGDPGGFDHGLSLSAGGKKLRIVTGRRHGLSSTSPALHVMRVGRARNVRATTACRSVRQSRCLRAASELCGAQSGCSPGSCDRGLRRGLSGLPTGAGCGARQDEKMPLTLLK